METVSSLPYRFGQLQRLVRPGLASIRLPTPFILRDILETDRV